MIMIYKHLPQPEVNSGETLSEQRRSCRLGDILQRAMRGAPLDIAIDDNLPGSTPEELEDWYVEPQFDDLNDAFEAGETLAANSEPIFESEEPLDRPASSRRMAAASGDSTTEDEVND